MASVDPRAVMGVFPSDHVIAQDAAYRNLVRQALRAADAGRMVVLGIEPRWPETGYGYIEFGAKGPGLLPVKSFREKPDLAAAKRMLRAGRFAWNAGMFFWRAEVLLEQLRRHLPRTATLLAGLPPLRAKNFSARLAEVYPRCENISIDYAVMEKAEGVVGLAAGEIGWNDVGSWNAVYELAAKDAAGNAARGDAVFLESRGNFVDGGRKLVALAGVRDLIVVDTPDALLVADRNQAQKVGDLVKLLEQARREELL
jgi:mannose-1-phosphate guanylyltransferase